MTDPQQPQPGGDEQLRELLQEFMRNVDANRLEYDKTGNDNYEWCLQNSIGGLNAYILRLQHRSNLEAILAYSKLDTVGKILYLKERVDSEVDDVRAIVTDLQQQLTDLEK